MRSLSEAGWTPPPNSAYTAALHTRQDASSISRASAQHPYNTDSVAVPETPPVVAVMPTTPIASAVASPFTSTLARSGCEETHVKVCPGTGLPLASDATAVYCCVSPTRSVAVAGLTTTAVTTWATVRTELPGTPASVAGIVALPVATAVTIPPGSARATSGLSLVHVNACPGTTLPFASRATAANCCVWPSAASAAAAGVTTTCATAPASTAIVGRGCD